MFQNFIIFVSFAIIIIKITIITSNYHYNHHLQCPNVNILFLGKFSQIVALHCPWPKKTSLRFFESWIADGLLTRDKRKKDIIHYCEAEQIHWLIKYGGKKYCIACLLGSSSREQAIDQDGMPVNTPRISCVTCVWLVKSKRIIGNRKHYVLLFLCASFAFVCFIWERNTIWGFRKER